MSVNLEDFRDLEVRESALIPFGFVPDQTGFSYRESFMAGDFEARLAISEDGEVTSEIWDVALDEPYLAWQIAGPSGPFVAQVKSAYQEILERVVEACFDPRPFHHPQTRHLTKRLTEVFGDVFDHPFQKDLNYRSFRVSGKWYALIFPLNLGKLSGTAPDRADELVEVLNLKVASEQIADLLAIKGIYPSYHMSKKNWVSIVLDGTVADDLIWDLLVKSRYLVDPRSGSVGPTYWVQPANPAHYDIDREFATQELVSWEQKGKVAVGDWVLIYITAPIQALRYLCEVVQADDKEIWLRRHQTYSDQDFPLSLLRSYGLKSVRSLRRVPQELIAAIKADLG